MARIVVTNRAFPETLSLLRLEGEVLGNETLEPMPRARLLEALAEAEALMVFMTDLVDEALLARAPRLKVVGAALKGFDNIDLQACARRGVQVTIVPDLLTVPTAELAIGLMIGLARHLRQGDALLRSGGFAGWRPALYGTGLAGSTVGIVGLGRVGTSIAERLAGFGCGLLGFDPGGAARATAPAGVVPAELEALLASSDFLVLAAPLTPGTTGLLDRGALARMKRGALLVNCARGSLVDEAAVADALESGALGGYAADVFAFEDWARPDRPTAVEPRLLGSERTLLTPHLGSAVEAVRRAIELAAARNIVAALRGEAPPDLLPADAPALEGGVARPERRA